MIKGTVAIVGRPNVGKSTLFNQLTRTKHAIVDDKPGVTRDRIYGTVKVDDAETGVRRGFTLIDTGGFEEGDGEFQPFKKNIVWQQTQAAIEEADIILLMFDLDSGMQAADSDLVDLLRRMEKPVVFVCNKGETAKRRLQTHEFAELGLWKAPIVISAIHKQGLDILVPRLMEVLAECPSLHQKKELEGRRIAIIGRPNVGKSSILNRLLGHERALVSDIAGTTRDSLHSVVTYEGENYVVVDTAGMRRRARVNERLESRSVMQSVRSIDQADLVLLVIDASEGISDQDLRLITLTTSRDKPILLVVNKWDLIPDKTSNTARDYADSLRRFALKNMSHIPITFISCSHNQRVHKLLPQVRDLCALYSKRVETAKVNQVIQSMIQRHTPQLIKKWKKRVKFYYATQVAVCPPTFVVKCNFAGEISDSYKKYLVKGLRQELSFPGMPIRLFLRGKSKNEGDS